MTAIYDLTVEQLRAKADERGAMATEASKAGRTEEAKVHEQMAGLYKIRASQLERSDLECVSMN